MLKTATRMPRFHKSRFVVTVAVTVAFKLRVPGYVIAYGRSNCGSVGWPAGGLVDGATLPTKISKYTRNSH